MRNLPRCFGRWRPVARCFKCPLRLECWSITITEAHIMASAFEEGIMKGVEG